MSNLSPPSTGSAQGGGLSSVHHMRCHFRLAGEGVSKYRSSLNRKKLAIDAAAVCDLKLGELLANDPGVYLLRRVHLELGALLAEEGSEAQLAQRLGERLTGTIMLDVMRGGDNVLQFANQAEYVAQFIKDLLDGSAWEHWYYYPFARYRASSRPETLRRVLAENKPHLTQILSGLQRRGRIEALLNNGDPAQVAGWWAAIDSLGDTRQALQPLAAAVLDLAGRLNLWNGSPLSLSALLAEMESQQPALDWRDPRSLAATIFSAIAALVRRGRLRRPAEIKTVDLEAALRKLDWLDHKWLFDQLRHLAVEDSHPEEGSTPDLPLRKAGRPTARQSRLLHDLLSLLDDPAFMQTLDARAPTSAANAIRLFTRLADLSPQWQDDPLASLLINRILAAWGALQKGRQKGMRRALQGLGEPGEAVVRRLAGTAVATEEAADHLPWPGAGAALLLRAVLDARLPAMVHDVVEHNPQPALRALLAGILLRLSPQDAEEDLPPGLVAICGGYPTTLSELRGELQTLPPLPLTQAWLEILIGHRVLDESALHLFNGPESAEHELLIAAQDDLVPGKLGLPEHDRLLGLIAAGLIRLWSSWLRNFSQSSVPYLLDNFIHRSGAVILGEDKLLIDLETRPLDTVLEMAGYFDPLEHLSWLPGRRVIFSMR